MSNTPRPRSYQQILGDLIDAFLSTQGIPSLKVGSPLLSILEAAAQSDLRSSQDIFTLLNSVSLDKATGIALDRLGAEENVAKLTEAAATGTVVISDTSFVKKSASIFQGVAAPIIGSVTLALADNDIALWPATGSVYIGRGTTNYEGPLSYTSKTDLGTYWRLNLATPTVRFHNLGETVILGQGGNRIIADSTSISTPQANSFSAVTFRTATSNTLADGETSIDGVAVVCTTAGDAGNISSNSLTTFLDAPFSGATVNNALPFSNGRENEEDDAYRERIKAARRSRARGTALAIKTAVTGITAPDEDKRVTSASVVTRSGYPTTLYIDDGNGYEEQTSGNAVEVLIDSALGGEQYFQARFRPIAKAYVKSLYSAPFLLTGSSGLTVTVGGTTYTHYFDSDEFASVGNASAYEVVASINADQTVGFTARTSDGGTRVVIFSTEETNEDIQVIDAPEGTVDANSSLGFPSGTSYTAQIYKNDVILFKDGRPAVFEGNDFSTWEILSGSQTLIIAVDGTPALTYTFSDIDFQNASTGYITVGLNSLAAWVKVINAKIPGITASVNNGKLLLTSNAGTTTSASIAITGGTLVAKHMFATGTETGRSKDYTLDRNTAQVRLEVPLVANDKLSIGSISTRAFLESGAFTGTYATLASDLTSMWFAVDSDATVVAHGIGSATPLTFSVIGVHDWGNRLKIDAGAAQAFTNIVAGDYMIVWEPTASDLGRFMNSPMRVSEVVSDGGANNYLIVERMAMNAARTGFKAVAMVPVGANISRVFICGGCTMPGPLTLGAVKGVTNSVEIYVPEAQISTFAPPMSTPRAYHTCTVLDDGRILVTGGLSSSGVSLNTTEIYDPTTMIWSAGPTLPSRTAYHDAVKYADGYVVITGGYDTVTSTYLDMVIGFNPNTNLTVNYSPYVLTSSRAFHRGVLLDTGVVLVAGGRNASTVHSSTMVIGHPLSPVVAGHTPMNVPRRNFSLVRVSATTYMAVGGHPDESGAASSSETYDSGTWVWSAAANLDAGTAAKFESKNAVTLHNGKVVAPFTWQSLIPVNVPSIYQWTAGTWAKLAGPARNIDAPTYYEKETVLLYNAAASYLNRIVCVGGSNKNNLSPVAHIEEWNGGGTGIAADWTAPDNAQHTSYLIPNAGISFARSNSFLQEAQLEDGLYTPTTIASGLNGWLKGATAVAHQSDRYRIASNTFGTNGDIALVAQMAEATNLLLPVGDAVKNLTGHVGSVESGNSEIGTPSFQDIHVSGEIYSTTYSQFVVSKPLVSPDRMIVGLRSFDAGPSVSSHKRYGLNHRLTGAIASATSLGDATQLSSREGGYQHWLPFDRAMLAAPYAIGPSDDLVVRMDNDTNKTFPVRMWRTVSPTTNAYGEQNLFSDSDAADASLAASFGLTFSFNDYAAYMKARYLAFSADATRRHLIRYYRHGADGNFARVRFVNPSAASGVLAVEATNALDISDIKIRLAGGAAKTPTVRATTKIGVSCTATTLGNGTMVLALGFPITGASRATNVTTLTFTLPAGTVHCGLAATNVVWVQSTDPSFTSGAKIITGVTANTIAYADVAANAAAVNIGTLSYDPSGEAKFAGSTVAVGDFIRIQTTATAVNTLYTGETFLITAIADQHVIVKSGEKNFLATATTLVWANLGAAANISIFANPAQTVTVVAAAVNALLAAENSKCPVSITVTGSGGGVIDRSTPDFDTNTSSWYQLADGINWIRTTTPGALITDHYQLDFKQPVSGNLTSNADWTNEEVRLVPITATAIAAWMNSSAVSGLSNACSVQTSTNGSKVQLASLAPGSLGGVQIQGGLANSVTAEVVGSAETSSTKMISTVPSTSIAGLTSGMWCEITNEHLLPKVASFSGITSSTQLVSWGADGLITLNVPVYTVWMPAVQAKMFFEKQGRYVAISDPGTNASGTVNFRAGGDIEEGDMLRVSLATSPSITQVPSSNVGLFRVIRVEKDGLRTGQAGTVWIDNPDVVEGTYECVVASYEYNGIMPGDTLVINTDVWGAQNKGTWTVDKVGVSTATSTTEFAVNTKFLVSAPGKTVTAQGAIAALGTSSDLIKVFEGNAAKLIKKIEGIAPNQADGAFADVRFDSVWHSVQVSEAAGSVISPLDKLDFSLNASSGIDGYSYNTGLIAEAAKVVYGDEGNPATYPGVAAAGAVVNIAGPLVKRIEIALSVRVRNGVPNSIIADRVRSAVATTINQIGVGQPVALSAIIAAATKILGVVAVTVVSPAYTVEKDLISVQPFEKPAILNLDTDIQLSFVGE